MKKIIILIVAFLLLLHSSNCYAMFAGDDIIGTEYEEAVAVLNGYGIINGYEDNTFRPDDSMTRAEFSKVIYCLNGFNGMFADFGNHKVIYNDVTPEHWAFGYINTLSDFNIIGGYGDGNFGPEDAITYEQAIKVVVSMLGYDVVAQQNGGFPAGYINKASQLGLFKGINKKISGSENATRGNIVLMLYNALDVDRMIDTELSDNENWKLFKGETLEKNLEYGLNIKILQGQVIATPVSSLVGDQVLKDNQINISGVICEFNDGRDYSGLLGRRVVAVLNKGMVEDEYIIKSILPLSDKNRTFTLSSKDITDYSNYTYKYSIEDGKTKTLNIPRDISVVYNGVGLNAFVAEDLEFFNGTLTLLDSQNTGTYDVLFINTYKSYIVDEVDSVNNLITFKKNRFEPEFTLSIKDDDEYKYFVSNKKNQENYITAENATLSSVPLVNEISKIEEGDIVSIFDSYDGKTTTLVVSNNVVSGKVETLYYDEGEVVVNGNLYSLSKYSTKEWLVSKEDLELGKDVSFYIDAMGEIVAVNDTIVKDEGDGETDEKQEVSSQYVACVLDKLSTGALSSTIKIKVLRGNVLRERKELETTSKTADEKEAEEKNGVDDEFLTVYEQRVESLVCHTKVTLDGDSVMAEELLEKLKDKSIVEIWKNDEGKVIRIDTLESGDKKSRKFSEKYLLFGNNTLTGAFLTDKNTMYFVLPSSAVTDEDYEIIYYIKDGSTHTTTPYEMRYSWDTNEPVATAVVIDTTARAHEKGIIVSNTKITVVTKLMKALNSEGTVVPMLSGYTDGTLNEYLFRADADAESIADSLKTGDVVKLAIDSDGYISDCMILASLSEDLPLYRAGIRTENERALVKILDKRKGVVQPLVNRVVDQIDVSFSETYQDVKTFDIDAGNSNQLYVYDRSSHKVKVATMNDILTYMSVGDDASTAFIYVSKNDLKAMVIVK